MREALIKKMETLGEEARRLVEQREQILGMVQEIEVRLHQISGAISEIDQLLKEDKNEASKNNRSSISESDTDSTEAAPTY